MEFGARQQSNNPFNAIIGILLLVMVLAGLFYLTKIVAWILGLLMPVFLVATLVIDHKVVLNYGKKLIKWTKDNPLVGIAAIILTFVFSWAVVPYLFGKAMLKRKVRKMEEERGQGGRHRDEYVNYEELPMETETRASDFESADDSATLDLHDDKDPNPLDKSKKKSSYDELFEDLDIEDDNRPTKLW